jgi:hypothetical protein
LFLLFQMDGYRILEIQGDCKDCHSEQQITSNRAVNQRRSILEISIPHCVEIIHTTLGLFLTLFLRLQRVELLIYGGVKSVLSIGKTIFIRITARWDGCNHGDHGRLIDRIGIVRFQDDIGGEITDAAFAIESDGDFTRLSRSERIWKVSDGEVVRIGAG